MFLASLSLLSYLLFFFFFVAKTAAPTHTGTGAQGQQQAEHHEDPATRGFQDLKQPILAHFV